MNVNFGNIAMNIPTKDSVEFQRVLYVIKEKCTGRKFDMNNKTWTIPRSFSNFKTLKEFLPEPFKTDLSNYFKESYNRLSAMNFLRNYQREAVVDIVNGKRLLSLPCGAGKTICALAFIESMMFNNVMIIVPSSIRHQWKAEAKKFFNLDATILEGTPAKRKEIIANLPPKFIIITSYETARVTPMLASIHYDLIIYDECHKLKNSKSKTHKALKIINADYKLLMSATPMVNNPMEIYNVINFSHPNYFSYGDFISKYVVYDEVWTSNGSIQVPMFYKNLKQLHQELLPIMIYKSKTEILSELPPMTEQVHKIEATEEQKRLYSLYDQKAYSDDFASLSDEERANVLAAITMMRMLSDSPEILSLSQSLLAVKPANHVSPKVILLKDEIIPTLEGKTIIFTEYARMADILLRDLAEFNPYIVKGGIEVAPVLEAFKNDLTRNILISTDVLNFGVNLQFCSNVINADLPWSSSKMEQRIGRIHRIGQTANVLVINLIMKDSIEEKVYDVLKEKSKMFDDTIAGHAVSEEKVIKLLFDRSSK